MRNNKYDIAFWACTILVYVSEGWQVWLWAVLSLLWLLLGWANERIERKQDLEMLDAVLRIAGKGRKNEQTNDQG